MLTPGALVGSYRITGKLGDGGMGVVYAAVHVVLGSRAAIKVLHPEAAAYEEIVRRFINEARASAALKHRNIVQVFDCGQLADGQWFIALEYLDGSPLSRFIASHGGPIALPVIVQILGQAAHGLHVAHDHGFVHRDVKPDNIFLTQTTSNDHHVTVLDFGIAKLCEGREGMQTRTNVTMGTPAYMAPEQLRDSKAVDRRSDVYALGVVAYEMAAGRRPWGDLTAPGAVMEKQITALRPPDPRDVRADIAPAFAEVIARALAVRPDDRYATTQEFVLALAHATPGSAWSESGIDILRTYANELTLVDAESETVGRKVPSAVSHVGTPTVRLGPHAATSSPAPSPAGRSSDVRTVPLTPGAVPILAVPAQVASSAVPLVPMHTTLSVSSGQSVAAVAASTAPQRSRRRLMIGASAVITAGLATTIALVALTGSDGGPTPARSAAPGASQPVPPPATSALAVLSEPGGARVFVDGAERGTAPLNVPAMVGAEVVVRVELPGHAPATETVRIGATPSTVRLTLAALLSVDAGVAPDLEPEPATERKRRSRPKAKPQAEGGFNPDDVVGE